MMISFFQTFGAIALLALVAYGTYASVCYDAKRFLYIQVFTVVVIGTCLAAYWWAILFGVTL